MNSANSISLLSFLSTVSSLMVPPLDLELGVKILASFMMLKTPSPTFLMTSKIALALPMSSVPLSSVLSSAVLQSLTRKIIRQ